MSTSPIGSQGYTDTYSLLQSAQGQSTQQSAQTSSNQSEDLTSRISSMGKDIQAYLSEIPKGEDGKLSFQEVEDYRTELELQWDVSVMADLEALGVDITNQFPLSYDPASGKVTVSDGHPDKATIDKYFEDNPDKVVDFEKIIQLGKLTQTSSTQMTQSNLMQSIQQQSIAWWYEDNSDPTTWFSGGGKLFGMGQSSYTGLNITV